MGRIASKEELAEIGKNTRFTKETAVAAQQASAEARSINAKVANDFARRLSMKRKGSALDNSQCMAKNLVEGAADGDIQCAKLVIGYLQSTAPKETTIEQTENGIRIVSQGVNSEDLIDL